MPFPAKVQPADSKGSSARNDPVKTAATVGGKSRLKRLFERQFPGVLRITSSEKLTSSGDGKGNDRDDCGGDIEPSSVCLDRMVFFMEESNEKSSAVRCGRSRCNCFNGNCDDSSDDEFVFDSPPLVAGLCGDAAEILRGLVPCVSITERNLLADASKIVDKSKIVKGKADCRKIAAAGLRDLGYDASLCKSQWEKTPSFPAGEYEYVDVIVDGERYLLDVDFRPEFQIARSTKNYRAILQLLPAIFVGKEDRLQQIVTVVSEAARMSLKKKGLHFPPWRKSEYMLSKWLSPYHRNTAAASAGVASAGVSSAATDEVAKVSPFEENCGPCPVSAMNFTGEFQIAGVGDASGEKITVVVSPWKPPAVKPKAAPPAAGSKVVVAGLASVLREKPTPPYF